MELNRIEEEVISLKAINEIIDSMLNFEILSLSGSDPDSRVRFESSTHLSFFNIVLVDFLSMTDKRGPVKQASYLGALRSISENACFNTHNSIERPRLATQDFAGWLQQEVDVDIWLRSIDTKTAVKISGVTFLEICGDIFRHNLLRADGVAEDLQRTLAASGISISIDDALLSLGDFYARFHTDILGYHASTIAECLNNIRWGIYECLHPEFQGSTVWDKDNPPLCRYTYPRGVSTKLAQECYWALINDVRRQPYMRMLRVSRWLKLRY